MLRQTDFVGKQEAVFGGDSSGVAVLPSPGEEIAELSREYRVDLSTAPASVVAELRRSSREHKERLAAAGKSERVSATSRQSETQAGGCSTAAQQGDLPEVFFDLGCSDPVERERRIQELAASAQAEGPYSDVLLPGDYPEAVLQSPNFRAAAAQARKYGNRIVLASPGDLPPVRADKLLSHKTSFVAALVSREYEQIAGYGSREIFDALWAQNPHLGFTRDFLRLMEPLYDRMTAEELSADMLYRIERVNNSRLNRLIGLIREELGKDRARLSGELQPYTPRMVSALDSFDKLSLHVAKMSSLGRKRGGTDEK